LTYLWDYSVEQANVIMTAPEYTRATFVRDPKEKFYSLYKDIVQADQEGQDVLLETCCPQTKDCLGDGEGAVTPSRFLKLIRTCRDPRWMPQEDRMEHKYWPYINFVGHWDNVERDAQGLLEEIDVWNIFGKSGWGASQRHSIASQMAHVYRTDRHFSQLSSDPFFNYTKALERQVEDVYQRDYDNRYLGFQRAPIVETTDFIYYRDPKQWDAAPVVVEEFKLVFFTVPKVACTTWKQLFRRIQGIPNWDVQDSQKRLPHDPDKNKLKYLWHYSVEDANRIMTSPDWTRAIFIRDPKERFLSAFLDKGVGNSAFIKGKCCPETQNCMEDAAQAPSGFLTLIQTCDDVHWSPQDYRMESKYWPYINFVGHFERLEEDAKRLLQNIGAWEQYGQSGWGPNGKGGIFQKSTNTQNHVTNAKSKINVWFTQELERRVERFYQVDYDNPIFEFRKTNLTGTKKGGKGRKSLKDLFLDRAK
jgi:hypothetical protein